MRKGTELGESQPNATCGIRGATMLEYVILVALIAMVVIVSLKALGQAVNYQANELNQKGFAATGGVKGCDSSNPDYPNC